MSVAKTPPLASASPFVPLEVPGHRDAVVSLPLGASSRRPVVVAAHGNYDRPEWQCQTWRALVRDRAFVLCPRGIARTDSPSADDIRFTYEGGAALARELDAALLALRARYPEHVGDDMLYAGFSLGAILGVPYVTQRPSRFPRVVLIEGGHDAWTAERVRAFAKGGGKRVLFACGQASCPSEAKSPAQALERAKVATKIVHGAGVGHGYTGAVAEQIQSQLEWLLADGERWATSSAP